MAEYRLDNTEPMTDTWDTFLYDFVIQTFQVYALLMYGNESMVVAEGYYKSFS